MGVFISNSLSNIPSGVIVFLSSYQLMNDLKITWQNLGILKRMKKNKKIFFEKQKQLDNSKNMENYKKNYKSGAILFAVMGGKLSEGFDFLDDMARAIFIIRIPYPYMNDPKLKKKKKFFYNK